MKREGIVTIRPSIVNPSCQSQLGSCVSVTVSQQNLHCVIGISLTKKEARKRRVGQGNAELGRFPQLRAPPQREHTTALHWYVIGVT